MTMSVIELMGVAIANADVAVQRTGPAALTLELQGRMADSVIVFDDRADLPLYGCGVADSHIIDDHVSRQDSKAPGQAPDMQVMHSPYTLYLHEIADHGAHFDVPGSTLQ